MECVELELMLYCAIAYPDVCQIDKYETPIQYEKIRFRNLVIWRHSKNSKVALITISGGSRLHFCQYIQKLVDGLELDADIYGLENFGTFNLCCIEDIVGFIRSIANNYENIIVMGFSLGGAIGSQVLAQLDGENHATLICIGTPFDINNSTELFDNHMTIYRPDVKELYFKSFQYSLEHNVKVDLADSLTLNTYEGYARFIEKTYKLPNFRFLTKMNPNIPNCRVISFYNERELLVRREYNVRDIEFFKRDLDLTSRFEEYAFETWVPGHVSEWATEENARIICRQIRNIIKK